MAGKLTKDQKRAKEKREAQKKARQRQHETNRDFKKYDHLDDLMRMAVTGMGDPGAVERGILNAVEALSVAASQEASALQGREWRIVRESTRRLVSLSQNFLSDRRIALQGRMFHTTEEYEWVKTTYFSMAVAMVSKWAPFDVFGKAAAELEPAPKEGVYFFGFELGSDAVHLAVASNKQGSQEYYVVTAKGWRMIPAGMWHGLVWPLLADAWKANSIFSGPDVELASLAALCELQEGRSFGKDDPEWPSLNAASRQIVTDLTYPLGVEGDMLLEAAFKQDDERLQDEYDSGWADGYEASEDEIEVLSKALATVRGENAALKRAADDRPSLVNAAGRPSATSSDAADEVPLHQRMSALLGLSCA